MYVSYWLLLGGLLVAYRTWTALLLLALMLAAMVGRARREEEALAATFGAAWQEYAARVPRFVPRWRR
jgi:protein-S-isoprenylcysteine O-methyltransferase Ste14